jgi:hypothetical protein
VCGKRRDGWWSGEGRKEGWDSTPPAKASLELVAKEGRGGAKGDGQAQVSLHQPVPTLYLLGCTHDRPSLVLEVDGPMMHKSKEQRQ